MYVPKNLKLNRFRVVQIPSAKEIIARFGLCTGSHFSGDEVAPRSMHKTEAAAYLDHKDAEMNRQEQLQQDYEDYKNEVHK